MSNVQKMSTTNYIMLTGFQEVEKSKLIKIIQRLGGVYCRDPVDSERFLPTCTHVIAKKPCRSQKFLCACASGKWVLVDKYVLESGLEGKWIDEIRFEWGHIYKYRNLPKDVQQAPSRWRLKLKQPEGKAPFSSWIVGLSASKSITVYKRLIETGGGLAFNLKTTERTDFTHIVVDKGLSHTVKKYHELGIPCLRCEYLGQYLLRDPPPHFSEFSVFPNQPVVGATATQAVNEVIKRELVVRIDRLQLPANSNNNNNGDNEQCSSNSPAAADAVPATQVGRQESQATELSSDTDSTSRENVTKLRQSPDRPSSSLNPPIVSFHSAVEDDSCFSDNDRTFTRIPVEKSKYAANFTVKQEKVPRYRAFEQRQTSSTSSDDRSSLSDVDITHVEIPDSIRSLRPLFRSTLAKLKPTPSIGVDFLDSTHNSSRYDVTSAVRPCRFGRREMLTVEGFVEVNHSVSVLRMCRSLLSASAYPPPDLLYLLMKKYLLDTDKSYESEQTLSFLNILTMLHPPNAPHIRHDDVYLQAMGVTRATESSLLASAELEMCDQGVAWHNPRLESEEWNFYNSIVKQAANSDVEILKRHNAAALLTIIASILSNDRKLLRHLFWTKSNKFQCTGAITRLVEWLRTAIEKIVDFLEQREKDGSTKSSDDADRDEVTHDDVRNDDESSESESEAEETDSSEGEYELWSSIHRSLTRTVLALCAWLRDNDLRNFDSAVVRALYDEFVDVRIPVLESLLIGLPSSITLQLTSKLLEKSSLKNLCHIRNRGGMLSLHRIINRYFCFVPKPPQSILEQWINSKTQQESVERKDGDDAPLVEHRLKLSTANVNKRNCKGETALHQACIQNKPDHVTMILEIPGVDPNARDNAGWTPISEACNRGHVDCVRQLLKLPLAPMTSKPASSVHTSSNSMPENRSPPKLEIDLLACPEEGVTPLHDALRNGHVSVAELLLEKGGVDLLHVPDKAGKTPIDVSHNQEIVSSIIVTACSIACNQRLGSLDPATSPESASDRVCSSEDKRREMYKKMLPPDSLMSSDSWIDACNRYVMLVRHLLHTYVTETSLVTFLCYLDTPEVDYDGASDHVTDDVNDSQSSFYEITHHSKESASDVTDAKLRRYEQDVYYVLKWPEIERNFQEHLSKLLPPDSCYLPQTFNVFQGELMDRIKSLFQ